MRYFLTVMLLGLATVSMSCNKSRSPGRVSLPPPEAQTVEDMQVVGLPEPVTQPLPQPVEIISDRPTTYTIQKGDTLWSIAQQVYGSGKRWKDIADANDISNPNKLAIGQILPLPQ